MAIAMQKYFILSYVILFGFKAPDQWEPLNRADGLKNVAGNAPLKGYQSYHFQ